MTFNLSIFKNIQLLFFSLSFKYVCWRWITEVKHLRNGWLYNLVKFQISMTKTGIPMNDLSGMVDGCAFNCNIVLKCVCLLSVWRIVQEAGLCNLLKI